MNTGTVLRATCLLIAGCIATAPISAQELPPCDWPSVVAVLVNGEVNGTITAYTPTTIDFYLMNAEVAAIGGFELAWSIDPDPGAMLLISPPVLPPGSLNLGDIHNLIVGIGLSCPYTEPGLRLASFSCIGLTDLPCSKIYLSPASPASLPGQMAYNNYNDPAQLIPMQPISGDLAAPVGSINCSGFDLVSVCGLTPEFAPDLTVGIAVTAGARSDTNNVAATSEVATDAFDSGVDVPEPGPPPDGDYLIASYWHPDWPLGPRFRTDVRSSLGSLNDTRTWPFRVENMQADVDLVTLTFAPDFDSDAGILLRLHDLVSDESVSLFPDLVYTYTQIGPGTRDFEFVIGGVSPLEPTSRFVPAGWSLLGLPLQPQGAGTLGVEILADTHAPAYLYSFSGGTSGAYVSEAAGAPATLGTGYWIASLDTFTWTMTGTPAITTVELPLDEGFNLVGNPLWFPGDLSGLRVRHGGNVLTFDDAVSGDLVAPAVWSYDPLAGSYSTGSALNSWHGYWFRVYPAAQGDFTLLFDWTSYGQPPQPLARWDDQATGANWHNDVTLESPDGSTATVTIGAHQAATNRMDVRFDLPVPPAAPAATTSSLRSVHDDWDPGYGRAFGQDIVGTETAPLLWDLEIRAATAQSVTLRWNPDGWPTDRPLELYRLDEHRVLVPDLTGASRITLTVGAAPVHLHLRSAAATTVADAASAPFGVTAAPNPGNPGMVLRLALARDADVLVHIFDVRGQAVRAIPLGKLASGNHDVTWQGNDDAGRALPSGAYFAVIAADGTRVGSVARLMLVR